MRDDAVRGATDPDLAGQRAGIDPGQADAAIGAHPFVKAQRGPEVARIGDVLAHHAAQRPGIIGLQILIIGTDIADMRKGEGHDLAGIRGIVMIS